MPFSDADKKQWGKEWKWTCMRCGRQWKDGWLMEFHHRTPSSMGGTDTKDNCELLCQGCHASRHREIEHTAAISAQLIEARLKKTGGKRKEVTR